MNVFDHDAFPLRVAFAIAHFIFFAFSCTSMELPTKEWLKSRAAPCQPVVAPASSPPLLVPPPQHHLVVCYLFLIPLEYIPLNHCLAQ